MKDETAIGVNVWQRRRVTKLAQKSAGRTKMTRSVSHIVDVGRRNVAPLYRIVAVERTDDARPLRLATSVVMSVVAVIARRRAGRFSLEAIPSSALSPQLCPASKPPCHFKSEV